MRRLRLFAALAAVAVVVALGVSGAASPSVSVKAHWVIRDLGATVGRDTEAVALNERGDVVVHAEGGFGAVDQVFLWRDGRIRLIARGQLFGSGCLNDAGQVVGTTSVRPRENRAFLWRNGKLTVLGTVVGGGNSRSIAINNAAQVIGASEVDGRMHAFFWAGARMTDLGSVRVVAINNSGKVIGRAGSTAFLWSNGKTTSLGTLGGSQSKAAAINNRNQVVGSSISRAGIWRAFQWIRGAMIDLRSLASGRSSLAKAINENGQIVGQSEIPSGTWHAFLWQNRTITDLGTLPGASASTAIAINDAGRVIGDSRVNGNARAFVWQDGTLTELDTLRGGRQSHASTLNNHGQIVGWATSKSGLRHAVLWTLRAS